MIFQKVAVYKQSHNPNCFLQYELFAIALFPVPLNHHLFYLAFSIKQITKEYNKNRKKFWSRRVSVVVYPFQNSFQNQTFHEESSRHFYIQSAILFRIVFFFDIPDAAYFLWKAVFLFQILIIS